MVQERREHRRLEPLRGRVAAAHDEGLDGAAAAAARLGDDDPLEQQPQLAVQQARVSPPENLGDEGAAGGQDVRRDVESREQELRIFARYFAENFVGSRGGVMAAGGGGARGSVVGSSW